MVYQGMRGRPAPLEAYVKTVCMPEDPALIWLPAKGALLGGTVESINRAHDLVTRSAHEIREVAHTYCPSEP